jgi:hypothetical protein
VNKKLALAVAAAATAAFPAPPAAASDGPPAGIRPCGPMQMGFVVWVADPKTGEPQDLVRYCVPIGP